MSFFFESDKFQRRAATINKLNNSFNFCIINAILNKILKSFLYMHCFLTTVLERKERIKIILYLAYSYS
eukprot:gene6297-4531_t